MVSTLDKATAHYGSVTALQATDDGLYLFSAGMALLTASGSCYNLPCIYTLQILDTNSVSRLEYSWAGLWHCSGCTGTDSRVRLWDMQSGCNTLVNYEATRIRTHQGTQLAVSSDSSLLFVASAHSIQVTITTLCNTTNTPYCPYWMLDFWGLWGWKGISKFQNIITIAFNEPLYTMRSCNQTGLYYLEVHIFESTSVSNSENLQHYIKQGVFFFKFVI
jgi:hypothetical protein